MKTEKIKNILKKHKLIKALSPFLEGREDNSHFEVEIKVEDNEIYIDFGSSVLGDGFPSIYLGKYIDELYRIIYHKDMPCEIFSLNGIVSCDNPEMAKIYCRFRLFDAAKYLGGC